MGLIAFTTEREKICLCVSGEKGRRNIGFHLSFVCVFSLLEPSNSLPTCCKFPRLNSQFQNYEDLTFDTYDLIS